MSRAGGGKQPCLEEQTLVLYSRGALRATGKVEFAPLNVCLGDGALCDSFFCFNTKELGFLCPDHATTHVGAAPTLPAGCLCPMGLKDWLALATWVQSYGQLTPEAPPTPPSGG